MCSSDLVEVPANLDPTRRAARVTLDGAPAAVIAGARRELVDLARLMVAAEATGVANECTEQAAAYAKVRVQFGRPIGQFQAVKHALADALLALEMARPLVYAAAWAHVHDAEHAERDVAASRIRAGEAAGKVARTALQAHGGMGYTQENDLHLWLKRTWALQASWGRPGELRERLAQALDLAPGGIGRNR